MTPHFIASPFAITDNRIDWSRQRILIGHALYADLIATPVTLPDMLPVIAASRGNGPAAPACVGVR